MPPAGSRIRRADLILASGVVVLAVVEALSLQHHRLVGVVGFVLMGASLAVRRRWPLVPIATAAVVMVVVVVSGVSLNAGVSLVVVVMVASYSAGAYLEQRTAVPALAILVAGGAASVLLDSRPVASNLAFVAAVSGIPWGLGVARRRYGAVLEERNALLENEREARAEAAVAEERARIARELHDIVSHSLSVISLQAGGVRRLLAPYQEKQRQALMAVEHSARNAIEEMHHMLGLLRADGEGGELNPQPGLAQLPELLDRSAAAGLTVTLTVEGRERPLSPGVELAVYRVVQEALTNVTKHSDATDATVTLRYDNRSLHVAITDRSNPTDTGAGVGLGLRGMRERVAVYHGTLTAGPLTGGGYEVAVELPYPVEPS
jgi:signal transduction histidine kinase